MRTICLLLCVIAIGCSSKAESERVADLLRAEHAKLGLDGSPMFEKAKKVRFGMSLSEVNGIFGFEGEAMDLEEDPDHVLPEGMESLTWNDETAGPYALSVMLLDGKVFSVFYFDGANTCSDNEWKRTVNYRTVEQRK